MLRNSFRITPNNLRIHTEHFRFSLLFSPVILMIPKLSLMRHQTLKCVTLRFGNTADMVETPLRPMIISGTWMPIMTPVHSTRICR